MVKKAAQDPKDSSLQMKIRQYLIFARPNPTKEDPNPKVFAMRVFGRNHIVAKTRFWWNMRRLNKLKRSNGQILSVKELYERNSRAVKTYGIVLKYQSRTTVHNMYKEFRDVTLNGAISQLYQVMSGSHRAHADSIQIIRTSSINEGENIKRAKSNHYRVHIASNHRVTKSNSPLQRQSQEPVPENSRLSSRQQDPTSSGHDLVYTQVPQNKLNNIAMSRIQSNNDVRFNNLTTSDTTHGDLNTSTFSHSKMQETSQNGVKNLVSTKQYLEQIDKKYQELYKEKKHKKHNHNDYPSTHTQHQQHEVPNKFKQQPQQQQQQQSQIINQQIQPPTIMVQPLKTQTQLDRSSYIPQRNPSPIMNIPNDISLSRGVSERGRN